MAIKIRTKNGDVTVENDVIASVVGGATIANPGVVGMASRSALKDGVNQILNRENYGRGVVVSQQEKGLTIDVYVVIQHGMKLADITTSVQARVKYYLNAYLGLQVPEVNVIVQGIETED
ncbi:Asp23/Gls24 family envelope stress response protein [Fructobacillus sp. M1-13]|uniref:Asp23/Gls24 family envelope stress response protein n=1 Tax=Fructobacillus papyriferae TaxID=2713171 RepID=A0ABS5QN41_9LACO|nr:Asp23/Gls24 family envelope stress response protein [Fructobacillus papyriferae]MBS9334493.1 Asp23/Gls24 family envelope stress response protein [Fructobacillus papyriferae]MCD2158482.1 Asp23/Gls24 family envelope stress response protein [Fructobacillus papyriferae]